MRPRSTSTWYVSRSLKSVLVRTPWNSGAYSSLLHRELCWLEEAGQATGTVEVESLIIKKIAKTCLVFAASLLLMGSRGCDSSPTPTLFVNDTDHEVTLMVERKGGSLSNTSVTIGAFDTIRLFEAPSQFGPCTKRTLVAVNTTTSEEIDRHPPPLCSGETWKIGSE